MISDLIPSQSAIFILYQKIGHTPSEYFKVQFWLIIHLTVSPQFHFHWGLDDALPTE